MKIATAVVTIATIVWSAAARAEPTGPATTVVALRPYDTAVAFVYVPDTALCGTSVFSVDLNTAAGKAMFAVLEAALLTGKRVALEVSNKTGCTGTYTQLQSVYAQP